jgi:hypothetical protein
LFVRQTKGFLFLPVRLTLDALLLQAAQRASHKGEAQATVGDASSLTLIQEISSSEAHTDSSVQPQHQQQEDLAKKPRARKRSKKK